MAAVEFRNVDIVFGTDQKGAGHGLTRRAGGEHAALRGRRRCNLKAGAQLDAATIHHRAQQGRMQVGAVGHPVWCAMPCRQPSPERQLGQKLAASSLANGDALGLADRRAQGVGHAETAQDMYAVRSDLDAGTFRLELGAALEHYGAPSRLRQGQRQRQPADAAACDQHRPVRGHDACLC